jgi:hypothetical protein
VLAAVSNKTRAGAGAWFVVQARRCVTTSTTCSHWSGWVVHAISCIV